MELIVNGETVAAPSATESLADFLALRQITPDTRGVAVAVNNQVVRRADWPHHRLHPGDRIEIVGARQGG